MATLNVSRDQDTIQAEIQIAAPRERVFKALTDPHELVQWWGQKGMYYATDWKVDVRSGGAWHCEGKSGPNEMPYHVDGEYVEVDSPRVVSYTWLASWSGSLKTVVRWELEAVAGGTRVKMMQSGFAQAPAGAQDNYRGWPQVMSWMRAYIEKGETVGSRPVASW